MKKLIFFLNLMAILCLWSCSDNEQLKFDTTISDNMFTFTAVEGGAKLTYKLSDPRISKVKITYKDEFGDLIYKVGDYSVNTILLNGFNNAKNSVPVRVSFLDSKDNESEVRDMSFSTLASNLYTFFDNVKVGSYWDGFQLTYELKGQVNGSATVYFVGENPNTHARDTLTLENFQLEAGKFTKAYSLDESQRQSNYTVVVTTEDSKQRIARKQTWAGIVGMERVQLPNANFELLDPFKLSREEAYNPNGGSYNPGAFGKQYLFDGDVKGTLGVLYYRPGYATPPFTFLTKENALHKDGNDKYFVLDIKKPAMLGEMRFYFRYGDGFAVNKDFDEAGGSGNGGYYTKLPCSVTIYAWVASESYNPNADQSTIPSVNWKQIGKVSQDPSSAKTERWYYNANLKSNPKTKADLDALKPLYLSVPFDFDENEYRYYKIEFDGTYNDLILPANNNGKDRVTCHEIEVYAKKQ
ncbi:DUF4959 domain-containing protein [uncultured Bacteroides sp.]|uniref:DUF4959 domain-containing protein n=1 Tax=uncultured Bacteroides sp. TaxID=162156 RepID=UPI002AAA8B82|nr:DUF4959 domain-containing protein [uncultured Bacteroides sp.]